jgi:hypothetical protein
MTALFLTALVPGLACGVEREVPGIEPPLDASPVLEPEEAVISGSMRREVVALNADRTLAVILDLEIDDLGSLPVGESVDVGPGGAVRASVMASGVIPERHPACQLVENPLPDEVNPCVDALILREVEQPVSLTGVLVLTVNDDDVVSGQVSAFWGEDDAVYGAF